MDRKSCTEVRFSPLCHVHTGNIFVDGDICRLGGYDNTLLGYRTSLYRTIAEKNLLQNIDVIMFGECIVSHVTSLTMCFLSRSCDL